MKNKILFFCLLFIFFIIEIEPIGIKPETMQNRIMDFRWMKLNQMNMPLTNSGIFGKSEGPESGFYWPHGYPNETYIFGAGLWVGGRVRNDTNPLLFDTLVTCGYEPFSIRTEFTPGLFPNNDPSNPSEKIYFSSDTDWPLLNNSGKDSILSTLDSYCTYNDYDTSQHFNQVNLPIGISVIQQTYAWEWELNNDILFFQFDIILDSTKDTLHNAFVSICTDCDIGDEYNYIWNDYIGFNMERELGFQWQNEPVNGWQHFPGIIGFKLLQGPKSNGIDTIHYYINPYNSLNDSIVINPNDTIGITSFKIFTHVIDPSDKYERYQIMSGYNHCFINPTNPEYSYIPFDIDRYENADKRFIISSGPFNLIPGDTTKIICAIIMSNDTTDLFIKADFAQIIVNNGWLAQPQLPETPELFAVPNRDKVTLYWENNAEFSTDRFANFAHTDSFNLKGRIIANPAYNIAYRYYDFEGYKLWKSIYQDSTTFQKIAHFDKIDNFSILRQDSIYDINGDTFILIRAETLGFDNGLCYMFTDTNIPYSNITYNYSLTAYDANYENYIIDSVSGDTIGICPTSHKSPKLGNMVGVIPANQQNFQTDPYSTISFDNGNAMLDSSGIVYISAIPLVNDILDDSTIYHLRFGSILKDPITNTPIYRFYIDTIECKYIPEDTLGNPILLNINTNSIESGASFVWQSISTVSCPIFGGIISIDSIIVSPEINRVDSIMLNDIGNPYNTDNLVIIDSTIYNSSNYTHINTHPYYNGGSYRITWHRVYIASENDSALTCTIYDIINGTDIPYSPYWDFGWRFGKRDSTAGGGQGIYAFYSDTVNNNWRMMYIDGVIICFNYHPEAVPPLPNNIIAPMIQTNKPEEGEEWFIYNTSCPVPSSGNSYNITFTKGVLGINIYKQSRLDKVTVIPTIFSLHSLKDSNGKKRCIMFKGLPKNCNISIYNLSGKVIDKIKHRSNVDYSIEYWDISSKIFTSGVYFYQVKTVDNKYKKSGKLVLVK